MDSQILILLLFILLLAAILGFELIAKVPSTLHTPLMSGSNAISGITLLGALTISGAGHSKLASILGILAVAFAMTNVVGGYLVTERMLEMFKKKEKN
ncbi:NAD(P) transhydrogenase subunit alpha [Candidatus Marinamargulisbacteria bacterium SCGC AAA071-K20]|nr:NAD(P) transhydrogenase subunit alpha [Candidatus Marinamargulisbacteria bacterium SCGC AAA071-K20]